MITSDATIPLFFTLATLSFFTKEKKIGTNFKSLMSQLLSLKKFLVIKLLNQLEMKSDIISCFPLNLEDKKHLLKLLNKNSKTFMSIWLIRSLFVRHIKSTSVWNVLPSHYNWEECVKWKMINMVKEQLNNSLTLQDVLVTQSKVLH